MSIPLLNKIYSATKQVNDAFSATNKTAFRTVVLVEFPHSGAYSPSASITSDEQEEVRAKTGRKLPCASSTRDAESNVGLPADGARGESGQAGYVRARRDRFKLAPRGRQA